MDPAERIYSCDDHLDLWNLPRDVWQDRLPGRLRERGPRVEEHGDAAWWSCDGTVMGPFGARMVKDYSAIARAGIEDDGFRAADPRLRLSDMERDGVWASVIYGPNLFGLPIEDPEVKAAALAAYNDWALEFNRHAADRLAVLPVLPTHAPEAATAELERVARLGHRGVIISPFEFRCSDPEWARFWDAAEATGLPVSFHIGRGTSQIRVAPARNRLPSNKAPSRYAAGELIGSNGGAAPAWGVRTSKAIRDSTAIVPAESLTAREVCQTTTAP